MAVFVRNLHTQYAPEYYGRDYLLFYRSELLRVAKYVYNSDNGGGAWNGRIVVNEPGGINGYEVDQSEPDIIYDPSGRFTQAMVDDELAISLLATNDQNRGAWRMTDYLGPNKVRVDFDGRPPYGWTPETGMPGRIWDCGLINLSNGDWILFDAPDPSAMQVRLLFVGSTDAQILIRPSGKDVTGTGDDIAFAAGTCTLTDAAGLFRPNHVGRNITIAGSGAGNNGTFVIASYISPTQITYANAAGATENPYPGTWTIDGDPTEVAGKKFGYRTNDRFRVNMVADGADVLLHDRSDTDRVNIHVVGALDAADAQDPDANVLWGTDENDIPQEFPYIYDVHMLDAAGAQQTAYATNVKVGWEDDINIGLTSKPGRRLVNGFAFARAPWIVAEDTGTGGYVRGRLPLIRFGWEGFAPYEPLDGAGAWLHLDKGLIVPRNGPNDPLPLLAKTGV